MSTNGSGNGAARARRLLTNHRAVRIANRTSAAMMAGAAAAIAAK
jgi:threonine/homoserine/homoserine lactone efflux protein